MLSVAAVKRVQAAPQAARGLLSCCTLLFYTFAGADFFLSKRRDRTVDLQQMSAETVNYGLVCHCLSLSFYLGTRAAHAKICNRASSPTSLK